MSPPLHADRLLVADRFWDAAGNGPGIRALALRQGTIVGSGTREETRPFVGSGTKVEDLGDRFLMPGLVDAHLHLAGYGRSLSLLDCATDSLQVCLERLRAAAEGLEEGRWILGHGWDQNIWGQWPRRAELDSAVPGHPVYLTARSLHAAAANSKALESAGLDASSPDPSNGRIDRDDAGSPTGILFEEAMELVSSKIPHPTAEETAQHLLRAQTKLWQHGLTGVHDFDGAHCFQALQLLHQRGELGLRVLKNVRYEYLDSALELGLRSGFGGRWLRIGNIKIFTDGALGPRTAAMFSPYEDMPGEVGLLLMTEEEILEAARRAHQGGFAMALHAIGDRANRAALNALTALGDRCPELPSPHRLEHLQLLAEEDLPRPGELGLIASMQPIHALSDQEMAARAWGDRVGNSYAWNAIHSAGATLAFGSDAPVESPNPFWGLHAAVARTPLGSEEPWVPNQRIELAQALEAYTWGPAVAAGNPEQSGLLAVGHHADFTVLEEDPFACPPTRLYELKAAGTMVDGEWVHRTF